jgi:hypothetical protein
MVAPVEPSRVLAGRYRLIKALGSGGMGTVWLALDLLLDREVAVKEVSPPADVSAAEREVLRERTMREARTAARLSHPNVVTIYDVVEDGDRPWIVMELVPARSLRDIVLEDGPLSPQQAAKAGVQLLAALRAAHALGILHQDVKPGNVLIDHDGRAVLADFGIARTQDSPTLTTTGILVGSPAYIAPECARGERGGPESDLWSLGATLYAVVEGRPPYVRGGALATLIAVVTENPDPSRRCGPLRPVISGLLCRDQAGRLGPAEAERMLRRIAGTGDAPDTAPLPLTAEDAGSGGEGTDRATPGDRLRQAERTRAFRTAAAELAAAPAVPAEPSPLRTTAGEDATPTPPTGLPVFVPEPPDGPHPEPVTASGPGHDAENAVVPRPPYRPASPPELPDAAAVSRPELPDAPASPRRRRPLIWISAAAAALMIVVAVLLGMNAPGRNPPGDSATAASPRPGHSAPPRPGHSAPAGTATSSAATSSSRPPPLDRSTAPPPKPRPGAGGRAVIPAGFRRYHDPSGFSIAVPDGWHVSRQGTYLYLTPPSGATFLLIDQSSHPKPSPLADWRQQEANRAGTYPGYHRIRLESITYPQAEKAADWEFTYDRNGVPTHVLNRNVLANPRHAYALYWSTPDSEWAQSFHLFRVFARTFHPARP